MPIAFHCHFHTRATITESLGPLYIADTRTQEYGSHRLRDMSAQIRFAQTRKLNLGELGACVRAQFVCLLCRCKSTCPSNIRADITLDRSQSWSEQRTLAGEWLVCRHTSAHCFVTNWLRHKFETFYSRHLEEEHELLRLSKSTLKTVWLGNCAENNHTKFINN